jgi:hypothetical protein
METEVYHEVFSVNKRKLLVTFLKGALVESFSGGGIRACALAMSMASVVLPPTVVLKSPLAELTFVWNHKHRLLNMSLMDDHFEEDISREIARIANTSRMLGYKIRDENRDMTPQSVYIQLGHSASLCKAVLRHHRKM